MFLSTRFSVTVITVGVLARLLWILAIPAVPMNDTAIYLARALSIASGDGYIYPDGTPTAYWPVGYPAFLGRFSGCQVA
jgi:hypothetical protein